MKCTEAKHKECDNDDMEKCKECLAPMWCLCRRDAVVKMRNKLWEQAK